jgi:isoleucyl-tRNA synthetase
MDRFDTQVAYEAVSGFFEVLNNWYIRRSRNRFWKSGQDMDKIAAYDTLFTCLEVMTRAMSSLLPLISEHIYLGLTGGKETGASVHLAQFPELDEIKIDQELTNVMDLVLDICSNALFIRSRENIRVRQPLQSLLIITTNSAIFKDFEELIKDEINVKSISYSDDLINHADLKLSINFQVLGKRLPGKMKEIIAASKQGKWESKGEGLLVAGEELLPEEFSLILEPKSLDGTKILGNNKGMISLDLKITEELEREGIARDLIRSIQQARKDAGFEVSDRIKLYITSDNDLSKVLAEYSGFIEEQTLAEMSEGFKADFVAKAELEDMEVEIHVQKIR